MGNEVFQVELQGVTPDLMRANGSYDPIRFDNLSADRICQMLQIIARLSPPDGDDVCPPNISITGPRGLFSFSVFDASGRFYCSDPDGEVSLEQAVMMVTGRPFQSERLKESPASVCGKCGVAFEADEAFCGNCGAAVR